MKPTSNYRMSGTTKASLALGTFKDAHQKGAWKRAMIQAELAAQVKPARDKGNRKNND
jgi:hypothetical protein